MNIIKKNFNYIASKLVLRDISKIDRIMLHHAAAKFCIAEDIHNWHLQRGFAGAGYNFLVRKDGSIYELRDIKYVPAHATNFNTCSIGICFEGNFEEEQMGQAQIEAGIWLVAHLKGKHNITLVQKHKDVNATSCPGKNFPFDEISNNVGIGTAISTEIKHDTSIGTAVSTNLKENSIYIIQKFLNDTYGTNLALDNMYGAETKKALIKALQTELNTQFGKGLAVDGIFRS